MSTKAAPRGRLGSAGVRSARSLRLQVVLRVCAGVQFDAVSERSDGSLDVSSSRRPSVYPPPLCSQLSFGLYP